MVAKEKINYWQTAPEASSDQSRWYAIYTKAAKEDLAVDYISRMGIECFNPKIRKRRKIWGALKEISAPLFPCYVFAKFGDTYLHAVRYARGVRRVVGARETPTSIDDQIIDFIRLRVAEGADLAAGPQIKPGDAVLINRGALYGLEGVFLDEVSSKDRVRILLNAIEWQARVLVEKGSIEKLGRE
jgi:transcriptional antiterminator RfaH